MSTLRDAQRFSVRELTARAPGAVAVLQLSGGGAAEGVRALTDGAPLRPGDLRVVHLTQAGEVLDEALCVVDDPEQIELHLHGSPHTVRRVVEALLAQGGHQPAAPASLEEQAEEALAGAVSEAGARILLDQAQGALRHELEGLAAGAELDLGRVDELLARGRVMGYLRQPPRVVLAGPVNAGKSTLFNVLVGHERVIVHEQHGTTRDAVRERIRLGAYVVELIDTAGERELDSAGDPAVTVERAGQLLGRELRRSADLVLWLDPKGRKPALPLAGGIEVPEPDSGQPLVVLRSRADEGQASSRGAAGRPISAREEPSESRAVVTGTLHEALGLPAHPWQAGQGVPFEEEQLALLRRLRAGEAEPWRATLESMLAR